MAIVAMAAAASVRAAPAPETGPRARGAEPAPAQPRKPGPQTREARARVLADLYARLARATEPERAQVIQKAIEALWASSGSETVDLLMVRAGKVMAAGEEAIALKLLDAVTALAPDYTEGWRRRAYLRYRSKDYASALADLRQVLGIDPNHFEAIEGVAQILREIGEKEAALAAYRRLLAIHPFWPGAAKAVEELAREVEGQAI